MYDARSVDFEKTSWESTRNLSLNEIIFNFAENPFHSLRPKKQCRTTKLKIPLRIDHNEFVQRKTQVAVLSVWRNRS